jgi:hypothetical protein
MAILGWDAFEAGTSKGRHEGYGCDWEKLKELNRDMVRGFPAFLARVGLQTYCLK